MKNDKILHDWINKKTDKEELDEFKQREEYDELNQLWEATEGMQAPGFDKEVMLKEILATPKNEELPKATIRKLPVWLPVLAAASVLLLLTFLFYPRQDIVEILTKVNEEQSKALPDGSKLTLYGNSKLNYKEGDWDKSRELYLTGSAKFEVEKGNLFTVQTNYGQIEVLGTIFTATAKGEVLEVVCTEGKVKVSSNNISLEDVIIDNESIKITNNQSMMVYKSKLTKLENVYLHEALDALSKTYNITFEIKEVNIMEEVTASFQHANLETALKTVLDPLNIKYELKEAVVYISQ